MRVMRVFGVVALIVLALVLIASTTIASAAGVTTSVGAVPAWPRVGQTVTVVIRLDSSLALGGFSGTLVYDPLVLRYEGNGGVTGFTGMVNANSPGKVSFNGINVDEVTGRHDVLTLTFTALRPGYTLLDTSYPAMAEARTFASIAPLVRDGVLWVARR
jgi:hypothetical protein